MGAESGISRIAVLMSCHDRRNTTLECLRRLYAATDAAENVEVSVFLVDDGSVDGTGMAVREEFPSVRVINGDGTLYWARGMYVSWKAALVERGDWDGYLWLNDDTALNRDAIRRISSTADGNRIVIGDLVDLNGEIVYGLRKGGMFTGNCAFIPKNVYERLGMICGEYSHGWADSDYALMAKRAGVAVASAGVVGVTEGHPNRPPLKNLSLRMRLKLLRDPKGWSLHDLWLYRRRNWGVCTAILSCIHMVFHVVVGEK